MIGVAAILMLATLLGGLALQRRHARLTRNPLTPQQRSSSSRHSSQALSVEAIVEKTVLIAGALRLVLLMDD